eukprot:SAG11_NODE_1923_length_4060_cov_4.514012_2_plen_64_part_00
MRRLRKDKIVKKKQAKGKRITPADLGLTNVKKEVADMTAMDVAMGVKNLIVRTAKSILAGAGK